MSDPLLRPLVPADLDETVAMQCRAMAELGRTHYDATQIALLLAATREPDYPEALLGNDVWLAVGPGGAILGSAGWGAVSGSQPPTGRIRKVFVEPGLAGRGLGRRLVEAAEARAGAAGCRDFVVRANLNAVPFYQRLGYRVTGPGTMTVAGCDVPMTMMEKPAETVG
ncbi:GNAT family N-acetyltransferase [Thalassobaculum sp.]|uniref:GNAT family N-acetyltransferase n=1 Tax=Thalassobaculum sp. TaxID=2022740 RepID=UPI0032EF2F46